MSVKFQNSVTHISYRCKKAYVAVKLPVFDVTICIKDIFKMLFHVADFSASFSGFFFRFHDAFDKK